MKKALQLVDMLKDIQDDKFTDHKYLLNLAIDLAKEAHKELTPKERALGLAAGLYDRYGEDIERMKNGLEPRCVDDSTNAMVDILNDVSGVFEDEPEEKDDKG